MLAHGVTDAGLCWTPVAEALAAEYDAIMVDARGHGHSDAPGVVMAWPNRQMTLLAITALEHSARRYSVTQWARPRRWSCSASPIRTWPVRFFSRTHRRGGQGWSDTPAALERHVAMRERLWNFKRKSREELIATAYGATRLVRRRIGTLGGCQTARFSPNALSVFSRDNAASVDWAAVLRRITCPALLITGDPGAARSLPMAAAARQNFVLTSRSPTSGQHPP